MIVFLRRLLKLVELLLSLPLSIFDRTYFSRFPSKKHVRQNRTPLTDSNPLPFARVRFIPDNRYRGTVDTVSVRRDRRDVRDSYHMGPALSQTFGRPVRVFGRHHCVRKCFSRPRQPNNGGGHGLHKRGPIEETISKNIIEIDFNGRVLCFG